jgi:cyclopropane fatty-acyl-phospholipid synthase-like methyltransferase
MENKSENWFENWFDSDYYHLLYNNRNEAEAEVFISNLIDNLVPEKGTKVLDLGCGKGRHSIYLHSKGLDVLGVDLSENSIAMAKKSESQHLKFRTGDMRDPQGKEEFDYVFNLFTSFGYFESDLENIKTLQSIFLSLKKGGKLVIDFMNAEKVKSNLVHEQVIQRGEIDFIIHKSVQNNIIIKKIEFNHNQKAYHFEEKVQAIGLQNFSEYFKIIGFQLLSKFGDYQLNPFDVTSSDRLIMIVQKPVI